MNFSRQADSRRNPRFVPLGGPGGAREPRPATSSGLTRPALLLWAQSDRYLGPEYGHRLAQRLPNATLEVVEDAGHWSWIDRPELIDRAVEFLSG